MHLPTLIATRNHRTWRTKPCLHLRSFGIRSVDFYQAPVRFRLSLGKTTAPPELSGRTVDDAQRPRSRQVARARRSLPLRTLVPLGIATLGIAKVFTDQVLPSDGVSGTLLVVRGLIRRHIPAEIAMAAMVIGLLSYDAAYLIVVLTSASILWAHHRINIPLLIGVTIFAVVTVAIPTTILGLSRWGERPPIAWVSKWLGATDLLGS
ncbi:hypothetical protein OEJ37_22155 [Burkholderia sp. BKH01]|uniref:hypothetical protein n=1 Tax=Burkholderia sp. BKH01 TaxID=2769262 RepID=UPI0021DFC979|nr:hypothetical protein [Burkholderia sp. BKH01]MCU9956067.1 hypothetical protein [Burkholderia sp. BKH01]